MIARIMTFVAALSVATAAAATVLTPPETSVPRMSRFLEWRPDGNQALFIRAETGQWYRATLRVPCRRMMDRVSVSFVTSPGDRFNRDSAVSAAGWRCLVGSVTESEGPEGR